MGKFKVNNKLANWGGYSKASLFINKIFNFSLALVLILLSLPFGLIIAIIIKLQDGGPVFYKGARLGRDKKPFFMYKFRTLVPDAESIIGAQLLSNKSSLITPFGKLFRDTRVDELPQLFNVLKGDMDFVGPRPERQAIYEKLCRHIKEYDRRFTIKPGLIGYSQLFTPHSSPKRIRSMIDNTFMKKKQLFFFDIIIVFYTILVVLKKVAYKGTVFICEYFLNQKLLKMYKEKRHLTRLKLNGAAVYIGPEIDNAIITDKKKLQELINRSEEFTNKARLININDEAILISSDERIDQKTFVFKMEVEFMFRFRRRTGKKTVVCFGEYFRKMGGDDSRAGHKYVIKYKPVSPLNYYILSQYFLQQSMTG
jgi:lipopolysaccharide/colanic/teichoic acid biosynthesis glycosyltransferase